MTIILVATVISGIVMFTYATVSTLCALARMFPADSEGQ